MMDARDLVVSASVITSADVAAATTRSSKVNCQQGINLPAGGVLYIPGSDPITLTATAAFRPLCVPTNTPAILGSGPALSGSDSTSTSSLSTDNSNLSLDETADSTPQYSDFRDPFYASTFPQCYALASTTVISYTLVIMLLITPRSFLDGGVVVLGRRGFTNSGSGGKNIGGRPWLQKVAALTVAISLTIATADTFRVAEDQYSWGIQNAKEMQDEVLGGTELKVIRIISDTFLWLAQAQTLIRLFPRQREKVIIKWTAFSLITLDVIFDCLNSFLYSSTNHSFTDAIPALSYLFELALGVLYAAWVIYYSFMKKRYAYYHPLMKNICLVAGLSLLAILTPVVFFVLDICKPDFTGWGDYVLWVGAAAASVIVWEWVERIEALEREEKKDGILGREVFDGDEMLDIMPSDFTWSRRRRARNGKIPKSTDDSEDGDIEGGAADVANAAPPPPTTRTGRVAARIWPGMATFAARYNVRPWKTEAEAARNTSTQLRDLPGAGTSRIAHRRRSGENGAADDGMAASIQEPSTAVVSGSTSRRLQPPLWPSRPAPAATPVSRTDTASADSTVYVMRYHPVSESGVASSGSGTGQHTQQISLSRSNSTSTTSSGSSGHERPQQTTMSYMGSDETSSALASGSPPPPQAAAARNPAANPVYSPEAALEEANASNKRWRTLTQALPFRRSAPGSGSETAGPSRPPADVRVPHDDGGRWDLRSRLEEFAATQAEKLRERIRPTVDITGLPVTVIPAPQRSGAMLARVLEEEESERSLRAQISHGQLGQPEHPEQPEQPAEQGSPELWRTNSVSTSSLAPSRRAAALAAAASDPRHY
ncbi:ph-response regulator protein palh rim21 [Ophiostoma piceae UAMH 11346]|uniref:Ph-response regulator protein palh rim21 n=1 Tax=Ophiostoma piceae (strain UAMH 11346) TaxID=1262450 RepID=S3C624_OPHP1|nr:ph-response regulator protein palh rim21 [Ophiostoma piceae UAMH 11346]